MTEYDKDNWQKALLFAFSELDKTGWPKKREGKSFAIVHNGKHYPNKLVLENAKKYLVDNDLEELLDFTSLRSGLGINEYLETKGANVYNAKLETNTENPNMEIIETYKELIRRRGNKDELYKWILINKFQGKPDLENDDFTSEITGINYQNLIFHNGIAVRNYLAKSASKEYKKCFEHLFDENIELHDRVLAFQANVERVYRSLGNTLHHHHDERTIATFLSFKYPHKYPLYKNSFYSAYCKKLGIKSVSKNSRYEHYIQLIKDFIENYIVQDKELLEIKSNFLTSECYNDSNNLIFAQDILYQAFREMDATDEIQTEDLIIETEVNMQQSLNQILYGPPGTGKTYHTINKAVAIANPEFNINQVRSIVKSEYQRLVETGQIVFTTFHQSISYEDFVEGIKPFVVEDDEGNKQVIYEVCDGIFKEIVNNAKDIKEVDKNEKHNSFDDAWNQLIELVNEALSVGNEYRLDILTPNLRMVIKDITSNGNLKLKPSKGGDKEYLVSYSRAKKLQESFPDLSVVKNIDKEFRSVIGGMNSTAYWSVLNFINTKIAENNPQKPLINNDSKKNFVLIIDEINRGNVSAIFGELITLIEDNKRFGNAESLEVLLPYSKEKFSVPSNLYIIGTMNTADRSVEALDTALRRRFVFEEMLPQPNILNKQLFGYPASEILEIINKRIEKLIDRDHCIGHAYFLDKDEETIIESFYKNIIPLLQEYFFGDYGKIGLVLGSGFIQRTDFGSDIFASFEYDYKEDLESKLIYQIVDYRKYENKHLHFKAAFDLLMNNA